MWYSCGRPQAVAQLGHQDLHLERLHLVGEHLPEVLGVEVGQRPGLDVLAAVGVALGVGVADARYPQLVELVVLADPGEGDAVVDLADLVQRPRRVVGHDHDARGRRWWPPATGPGRCPSGRTRPGPSSPAREPRSTAWSWLAALRPATLDEAGEQLGHLVIGHGGEAAGGDRGDQRVDAADQVGATGGRVLVGRLVQRLDGQLDRRVPVQPVAEAELDGGPGVPATRSRWRCTRSPRSGRRSRRR